MSEYTTLENAISLCIKEVKCPICQSSSDNFFIGRNITARFPIDEHDNHCGGKIYPAVECICRCGYIMAFSPDVFEIKRKKD